MSRTGQRLIAALKEAVAITRGDLKSPRVTVLLHASQEIPHIIEKDMNDREKEIIKRWQDYWLAHWGDDPIVKIIMTSTEIGTGITLECKGEKIDVADYTSW